MKFLRRASVALTIASMIAGAVRLKGKGGIPPQRGGWRELPLTRSTDAAS